MTLMLYCIICYFSHQSNYYSTFTIIHSKTILHVQLVTNVASINSALYFAVISDSVSMKILKDYLLTITIAVL